MNRAAEIRIGTSGYQYDHWRERFYPTDLPKRDWFEFYAEHFDTVEINNTFYQLPAEMTFDDWHDRAPPGFRYVLKYSRYGSHVKRLKDPAEAISTFLDRAERLKSFLGAILVQLPPNWHRDLPRLAGFLAAAPRRHRWAVEFRDRDWLGAQTWALLREHRAALCLHDLLENHPEVITAPWVYLRFHGPGGNMARGYSHQHLTAVARRMRGYQARGLDVYAFFNNDGHGHAVKNACMLKRYLQD